MSSAAMGKHVARQGECAASIAARYGLTASTLMARDGNRALSDLRGDGYVLSPGDIVDVPEPSARAVSFTPGGTARYRAIVPTVHLRMKLVDREGQAIANKAFEIVVAGAARPFAGSTDGDGVLDVELPAHHTSGLLRLGPSDACPVEMAVQIGHLDPITETSGVRGRLRNLGYPVGESDASLAEAVSGFQRHEGLAVTGIANDETRTKLVEVHGT